MDTMQGKRPYQAKDLSMTLLRASDATAAFETSLHGLLTCLSAQPIAILTSPAISCLQL